MIYTTRCFRSLLLAGMFAVLCAGCASPQVKPARMSAPARYSGFLENYSQLQADPDDPSYLTYVAPGFNPRQYRKFIVETPHVMINSKDDAQMLDPDKVLAMTNYYRSRMTAELSRHYQVVTEPGPGVARVRAAVVGAEEVMPRLKVRDLIPAAALFKIARFAVGKNPRLLRMSIESQLLDSQTGAVLAEAVDSRESTKSVTTEHSAGIEQLHQLIDFWVNRFVTKLDKANGFAQ